MKIAIFSDSYLPQINGVVTQIETLMAEILAHGKNEFLIIAPSPDISLKEENAKGIKKLLLPSVALPTYKEYRVVLSGFGNAEKALKEFKPDIIHVHTPFSIGWLGLNIGRKLNVPVIGTYHTHIPEFLVYLPLPFFNKTKLAKKLAWHYLRAFYNKCNLVTTPSNAMVRELERNGIKAELLPNAINFSLFNKFSKKSYAAEKIKIIYFGRIGYEKNIDVIIKAVKLLYNKNKSISLTILGSGPALESLRKLAFSEGISEIVEFHEPLEKEALAEYVSRHDIFVTASTIETQGLTIVEAMAIGLPCVGADFLAIADSIKDGFNGYLFKPFDHKQLAEKLQLLVNSESLRKKLGSNGIKTAEMFSPAKIAKETEKLYLRLIKA